MEASSAITGSLSETDHTLYKTILKGGSISSIALLAISIALLVTAHIGNNTPPPFLDQCQIIAEWGLGIGFFSIILMGGVVTVASSLHHNYKITFSKPSIKTLLLTTGLITTIFALTLLISSAALHGSSTFNDPKNSSYYPDANTLKEIGSKLNNYVATGSVMLLVGIGIMGITLLSQLPQKIEQKWEERKARLEKENATAEIRAPQL